MQDVQNNTNQTSSFVVKANDGECLDALVWRSTGRGMELVETVLADNPGLAEMAEALPEGTLVRITLNVTTSGAPTLQLEQLWD